MKTVLVGGSDYASGPEWISGSTDLLYDIGPKLFGRRQLRRMAVDSGLDRRALEGWGAQGTYSLVSGLVAFEREDELWTGTLGGADAEQLTALAGFASRPDWSPDGTSVVFDAQLGGFPDIFVLEIASGELSRLTHDPLVDRFPKWSPEGTEIIFSRGDQEGYGLAMVDAAGGPIRMLTTPTTGVFHISPEWLPFGNMAYVRTRGFFTGRPPRSSIRLLDRSSGQSSVLFKEAGLMGYDLTWFGGYG